MSYESMLPKARLHSDFRTKRGSTKLPIDVFYVMGQSNAVGATPVPNTIPHVTTIGQAYAAQYGNRDPYLLGYPFQNGSSTSAGFGQSMGWPHFASQWFTDTGRRSVWINLAVAGTPLIKTSIASPTNHWDVSELDKCLIGTHTYTAGGEDKARNVMMADLDKAIEVNPRFSINQRFGIWVQGEADANVAATRSAYADRLDALFQYAQDNYGLDYFCISELGRKGTDDSAVDGNEANYTLIRNAQGDVATDRSDTFMMFQGCKEKGSPLNTLTVDGNYLHVSGWAYQADGVHYTDIATRCLGRTCARNLATQMGLV
jgi:hypothetical protein